MRENAFVRLFLAAAVCLAGAQQTAKSADGKPLGNPQAPVRIELFSDFQCPGCKTLHEQTLAPLIQEYVNTGKVYLIRREYPLPIHAHAREAACYACAAERVGKYDQVCDQLFRQQESWAKDGNVAGTACSVLSPAEAKKVRALAGSPEIAAEVDSDLRAGQAEKLNGTPTMIITKLLRRYPVSGPVSYPVLKRFLDSIVN